MLEGRSTEMAVSVNVSMLWTEIPFLERFAAAREAGFGAVEFLWPIGVDLTELVDAVHAADLKVALFNFYAGDMSHGERGLLSDPERTDEFRRHVPVALQLANRLAALASTLSSG